MEIGTFYAFTPFQAVYAAETESEEEAFQAIRDFKSLKKKVLPLGVDGEVFFVQVNPTGW